MHMATAEPKTWIPVKEAARIAREYLRELMPEVPSEDISLEEIEPGTDEWQVTLGYSDPRQPPYFISKSDRIYKRFRIDAIDGNVLSMNIRKA
jgi:hypothetical protein